MRERCEKSKADRVSVVSGQVAVPKFPITQNPQPPQLLGVFSGNVSGLLPQLSLDRLTRAASGEASYE
jgi:hypothetical protein